MIYIVQQVISFSFTELFKYIRERRTQKTEEKTQEIDESKTAESLQESMKVVKEEAESETENGHVKNHGAERDASSENVEECSNFLSSKLVAQADSPKADSQIPEKTTSSKISYKGKRKKKMDF